MLFIFLVAIGSCMASVASADTYIKADTDTMNTAADWGGTFPGPGHIGQFNSTISASNAASLELGTNITIGVLFFGNDMNGPVEISDTSGNGYKLTLQPPSNFGAGIDMSSANQDVTINTEIVRNNNASIMLGGVGRTLTVGQSTSGGSIRINGNGGAIDVVSGSFHGGGYDSFFVGYSGTAIMNIRNAGTVVGTGNGTIRVGNTSSGTGTINVHGGKLDSRDTMYVGSGGGTGTVNVVGGEFYHDASYGDQIYVGDGAGGVGTITVSGGQLTLGRTGGYSGVEVQFGRNGGAGTLNINSGGTVVLNREFTGGFTQGAGGTGTINFNGGLVQTTWNRTLADTGVEYLVKAGGANIETTSGVTLTLETALEEAPASPGGGLTKSGAGILVLNGANTYAGDTVVSAGTLTLGNNLALQNSAFDTDSAGTLNVTGINTPTFGGLTGAGNLAMPANVTALILHVGAGITNTYSGILGGGTAMTLTKTNAGTQVLSGHNTYTGSTIVSNGTLVIGGSVSNSAVTVASNGALRGGGTVSNLTVHGTVNPGNTVDAPGTLSCKALNLESNAVYRFEMANVAGTPGAQWDLIRADGGAGAVNVNGSNIVIEIRGNPTGWDSGQSYLWQVIAAGTFTSFDTDRFVLNTDHFTPVLDGGTFSVDTDASGLNLAFASAGGEDTLTVQSVTPSSVVIATEAQYSASFVPSFGKTTAITIDFSDFGTDASGMDLTPCSGNIGDYSFTGFAANPSGVTTNNGAKTITFTGGETAALAVHTIGGLGWVMTNAATEGTANVEVRTDSATGTVSLTLYAPPDVTSLTPNSGGPGDTVAIAGSDFGAVQGASTVTFSNNQAAVVTYWSDTSITCNVPTAAETGPVTVTTDYGADSATFTVNWTLSGGGNHNGEDWSPANGTTIAGVHYGVGTFEVGNSATVSVAQGSALVVTAGTVTVTGVLSADEAGSAASSGTGEGADGGHRAGGGGGAYGGDGGRGWDNFGLIAGGAAWTNGNDLMYPDEFGSGGGDSKNCSGGKGGGVIKLDAVGTLTIDGSVSAAGGDGASATDGASGGGSGGSIWLKCATFSGSGDIRADGGQGSNGGKGCTGGGGGGGRIALHYATAAFSGDITASGGLGGHERGDAGTIYNGSSAWFPTVGGDHGGADWTLSSDRNVGGVHYGIGTFSVAGGVTATLVRHSALVITASQATVTGDINGDGAGGGRSAGAGLGDGSEYNSGSAGGGYGGAGGNGEPGEGSAIGGAAWTDGDDEHYPDEFGSDSGGGAGGGSGGGGGAVKLDIAGTLNLGGTISVNGITGGNAAGGGAGGSIWLECGALAGSGTLSARGGDGYSGSKDGGGGGGGRIAVYYTTGEFGFSTNVLGGAAGGVTASAGLTGTVYLHGPPKGTLFMFR